MRLSSKKPGGVRVNVAEPLAACVASSSALVPQDENVAARFRFDNFVVGESNRAATRACEMILSGRRDLNPLYLHGGSGLGKTHLLRALASELAEKTPLIVRFETADRFRSRFVEYLKKGEMEEFRRIYRSECDVLLLDDLHVLSKSEAIQSELLALVDDFVNSGRQVVFTSDRPVTDLKRFDERLCSRMHGGVPIEIEPPDIQLKVNLYQVKSAERGLHFDLEQAKRLAQYPVQSVRELEGVLKRFHMCAQILGVKKAWADIEQMLGRHVPQMGTLEFIKDFARSYATTLTELRGSARRAQIADKRRALVVLLRDHFGLSYASIGNHLRRNHGSVMYMYKKGWPQDVPMHRDVQQNLPTV